MSKTLRVSIVAWLFLSALARAGCLNEMKYVTLRNHHGEEKEVSIFFLGTDHLFQNGWTGPNQKVTAEQAFRVLDKAREVGITGFDTSQIYVDGAEHHLGEWLKANPPPKGREFVTLSKFGFPFDLYYLKRLPPGRHSPELIAALQRNGILSPDAKPDADGSIPLEKKVALTYASRLYGDQAQITQRLLEEEGNSLRNLNGHVTIALLHRDDGDALHSNAVPRGQTPVQTILRALADPEFERNVWGVGWSNWKPERIEQSLALTQGQSALPRPIINSPDFSLFEMDRDRTIHALGVQVTHEDMMNPKFLEGIKIMPYSPLGGFSILDQPNPSWETAKQRAREKRDAGDPYWQNVYDAIFTPENEARWHRVVAFTDEFNARHGTDYTVDQMCNAYVLAHPRTDLLAIGAITPEQLERTVASLPLSEQLTPDILDYLHSGKGRAVSPVPLAVAKENLDTFFKNYGLLASGFDAFKGAQSRLLAPDMVTEVKTFGSTKTYQGRQGYFQSLEDWSKNFRTNADFQFVLPKDTDHDGTYTVKFTGTITVSRDGKETQVPPAHNKWSETFELDREGRIKKLVVSMNLPG